MPNHLKLRGVTREGMQQRTAASKMRQSCSVCTRICVSAEFGFIVEEADFAKIRGTANKTLRT